MKKDRYVQCTRCRNKHMQSERGMRLGLSHGAPVSQSLCPRCNGHSFYDLTPQVAWCYASGLIEIGDTPPNHDGVIVFASGPKAFLYGRLAMVARHGKGKSAGKLLVPGIPEAIDQTAAQEALQKWLVWCADYKHAHACDQEIKFHI